MECGLRLHGGSRVFFRTSLDLAGPRFEVSDEALQRFWVTIEDEIVGQLSLPGRDLSVGLDVRGIDESQVQPRLDAVVQEYRVEHGASRRRDAKGNVGDTERD